MEKEQRKYFKNESQIQVYQDLENPDSIFKKYMVDYNTYFKTEDLKKVRQKLMAIKQSKNWPEFVIKPRKVYRLNKYSFLVEYPFIEGKTLYNYIKENDIDLLTCAKFIRSLEEKVMRAQDFVFPDIANNANIMIKPNQEGDLQFSVIDPDDIQFGEYTSSYASALVCPIYGSFKESFGIEKCLDENNDYNKQLDIRGMYGLFYSMLNGEDYFYPILFERKNLKEYIETLRILNIPIGSSLYERSMGTVSNEKPNELISDALFELIDDGYEFKTYGYDKQGYKHNLVKKRQPFFIHNKNNEE